jgi:apolipoprotein D and lipocalin family protein
MNRMSHVFALGLLLLTAACTRLPDGVRPVQGFELKRYLGEWHEVARMDHRFERGLTKVTATYSLREDGSVKVLNRGWNASKAQWKEAEGRAVFIGSSSEGRLKVSFFGPFYGAYTVIALDPERY